MFGTYFSRQIFVLSDVCCLRFRKISVCVRCHEMYDGLQSNRLLECFRSCSSYFFPLSFYRFRLVSCWLHKYTRALCNLFEWFTHYSIPYSFFITKNIFCRLFELTFIEDIYHKDSKHPTKYFVHLRTKISSHMRWKFYLTRNFFFFQNRTFYIFILHNSMCSRIKW